jgi:streptogramin lyase
MVFGSGDYTYEYADGWGKLPAGWSWGVTVGVACDAEDRVYVHTRGDHPLMVFDRDGNFLDSWGEDVIKDAHGINIDADGNVYCVERVTQCMCKFDTSGKYVMRIDTPGTPGEEGSTDVAISSTGELFISDGYENRKVRRYTSDGKEILSWGEDGQGPGQFTLVHSVRIDEEDRVWVCDRSNRRIQIFDTEGGFIREWTDLLQPDTVYLEPNSNICYIAEIEGQVRVATRDGQTLSTWGGGKSSDVPGEFVGGPHGIWVDSHGDVYVGQIGRDGPPQKYVRQ